MFIDQAEIIVKAGDGGNGCVSFRREKFIPKGGPDGGDGGHGGSVYLTATPGVDTLLDFAGKHHWKAPRGEDGAGKNRYGKSGDDIALQVPPGTIISDVDHGLILKDLTVPNQTVCVARGGRGGRGNARFASATNQTPRQGELGKEGENRNLKLELKLIADIGLVGLPNAGKSTLISRISAARPKIADYPFTTMKPNLGIAELSDYRRFVIADIPGLIEGSHQGQGLGIDFLKHIERTRIIAHLVDIATLDGSDAYENYRVIRNELELYSQRLAEKPEIVIATKMDLDPDHEKLRAFQAKLERDVIGISSASGYNVDSTKERLWQMGQDSRVALDTMD